MKNFENYRPELAKDLKEARNEDKDLARKILETEKQSPRYKVTKEQHLADRSSGSAEIETPDIHKSEADPEIEQAEILNKVMDIIHSSDDIEFVCVAVGNVLNQKNEKANGAKILLYDHKNHKLISDRSAAFLDGGINKEKIMMQGEKLFENQYGTAIRGNERYYVVRTALRPDIDNPFLMDRRRGTHMTLGVRIKIDALKNNEFIKEHFTKGVKTGFLQQIVDRCAEEFIPDYYAFAKSLIERNTKK